MKTLTISGSIVNPEKIFKGTITTTNGKITHIQKGIQKSDFNFKDNYILPGLIEVHGHLREPGFEQKEDVPHGTRAALAGGFTTIIDMPNTNPPTTTVELLEQKQNKIYPHRCYVDYSFFMGVSKDHLDELEKVDPQTIVGIKVFTAGHETTPTTIPDDHTLEKLVAICSKRNILLAVHAEDQYLINGLNEKYKKTNRTDPALWSEIRPKKVVVNAVERMLKIAEKYPKIKMYFLHLSTPEEFALIEQAKKRGFHVFGETVGYQLFFTIDDYKKYGNKIKVAPALREKDDQKKLWNLVRERKVDVICSEHTPHEWETKNQPNMWKAQAGTPGLQETLPALITKWAELFGNKNIEEGLKTFSFLMSKRPAEIFRFSSKGEIAVGKDADLTIIDVYSKWNVQKKDLFSKCGWSSYEGMNLIGKPIATFLRGQLVYENSKILGEQQGQNLLT